MLDDHFDGYGLMGQPFRSGHILAMRRFHSSSIGPSYTSIWHRDPHGSWTFYSDVNPDLSCARYFGTALQGAIMSPIQLEWIGTSEVSIHVPEADIEWTFTISPTAATRVMNVCSSLLPGSAWKHTRVLDVMSAVAGPLLGAGKIGLHGISPNQQHFIANPRRLFAVRTCRATIDGVDLGPIGPLTEQARLGDFYIPQRGILAYGQAYFAG